MKENILIEKSYNFSKEIIMVYKILTTDKKEYVLSRQLLKSGTSIGALIREGQYGQSKPDFINKFSIALKEANQTEYWLMLMKDTDYVSPQLFEKLIIPCQELLKLLTASINTAKANLNRK